MRGGGGERDDTSRDDTSLSLSLPPLTFTELAGFMHSILMTMSETTDGGRRCRRSSGVPPMSSVMSLAILGRARRGEGGRGRRGDVKASGGCRGRGAVLGMKRGRAGEGGGADWEDPRDRAAGLAAKQHALGHGVPRERCARPAPGSEPEARCSCKADEGPGTDRGTGRRGKARDALVEVRSTAAAAIIARNDRMATCADRRNPSQTKLLTSVSDDSSGF